MTTKQIKTVVGNKGTVEKVRGAASAKISFLANSGHGRIGGGITNGILGIISSQTKVETGHFGNEYFVTLAAASHAAA